MNKYLRLQSVHFTLILLVVLLSVPFFIMIVYSGIEDRDNKINELSREKKSLVLSLAAQQESIVAGAHQLLKTLSNDDDIQKRNIPEIDRVLKTLLKNNTQYGNILVADPDGTVIASARPFTPPLSIADRKFYRDVIKTKLFSPGEYIIGKTAMIPLINFGYPVLAPDGAIRAIIAVGIDLKYLNRIFSNFILPEGSTSTIIDHNGIILHRATEAEKHVGKPIIAENLRNIIEGPDEGNFTGVGIDGVLRHYFYKKIYAEGFSKPYLYITASVPERYAYEASQRYMIRNMAFFSLIFMATLISAILIAKYKIVNKIGALLAPIHALARGHLDQKVSDIVRGGEFGELALAFDDMNERLHARELENIQANEFLAHERERLSAIIRGTNVGTWEWNVQTGETVYNDRWAEIIGYTLDELSPVSIEAWMKFAHPDDVQQSGALLQRHFTGELDYYECESRMKHKNGAWVWVLDRGRVASWTEDGKPLMMFGTHQDVTVSKQAEKTLRESEERLRTILKTAQDGFWLVDASTGHLAEVNEAAASMLGYTSGELLTRGLVDIDVQWSPEELYREMQKVKEGGNAFFETRHCTKGGQTIYVEVSVNYLPANDQFFSFIRNITERKQAEEEKVSLEGQLRQAQKMDAIGTLAGGVAHDFNNILAAIIGYTEMAMEEDGKEVRQKYLQETLKGTERARDVVRQILTFSRQDGHEKRPLDIKLLLKESVKFLRASIPATIEIRQHLTDESCSIMADTTQMHQVIMNLCTNATHAMKQAGGVLTIELSPIELSKAEIPRYPDLRPGPYVRLTISDTGHGIDPAHIQRIFDPFFTTKPTGEGTGLGLSVVYGIIKSHDGAIHVYSEPGQGSSFSVYLPRIIHENNPSEIVATSASKGTERILFVDDEPALVDIGINMLSALGYEVTGVNSSLEALDLFRTAPESFDLVITDMTLPKMTGIELSREILQIRPDMPIVLCSGIREADTEEQANSLGIKAYCMKPLTRQDLSRHVRNALDG